MASISRGKALNHSPSRTRGSCPGCERTRIKLIYERTQADGSVLKVCKNCRDKKQLKSSTSTLDLQADGTTGQ
ncbi:hypothetical protein J2Z66_002161 [Paenibacillus eucommiae]|uniref:Uncharacterized protein n=1 Tax=Paenibacillus eucommiae TaxID=1355755 RepID=A0ABS4ISK1_9BACL|nr:hypothetical protein [Paenibacillus eucommiae]